MAGKKNPNVQVQVGASVVLDKVFDAVEQAFTLFSQPARTIHYQKGADCTRNLSIWANAGQASNSGDD